MARYKTLSVLVLCVSVVIATLFYVTTPTAADELNDFAAATNW